MVSLPRLHVLAAVAAGAVLFAGAAVAQSRPTLSTMPPPPSSSDPTPKDEKPKANRKATGKTRSGEEANAVAPAAKSKRSGSTESSDRPSRFVPEGFEDDGSGGRAKPFMSESGRPGVGMRF